MLQDKSRHDRSTRSGRAYGILTHAYSMTSKEALNLLSIHQLGVDLGFLPEDHRATIDELFIRTQPAHLQKEFAAKAAQPRSATALRAGIYPRETESSSLSRIDRTSSPRQARQRRPAKSQMMNNFTPRAQQVLALARKEADRFNHNYVGTEHLLLGLIKLGQGVAVNVLQKMGLDLETVRMEVEKQVGTGPETKMVGNIPYTPRVKKVLALAGKEAKSLNHSYVGTEHILLGLLREGEGVAARVLKNLEVDIERTRNEILKELDPNFTPPRSRAGAGPSRRRRPRRTAGKKDVKTPALARLWPRPDRAGAQKGELDPVIGRKNEIERVIQILCRRTKNNPVLIGEAGVGKTAIVGRPGAGNRRGQRAGTSARQKSHHPRPRAHGRGHQVSRPVRGAHQGRDGRNPQGSKNVILFIDELHTIVGAGSAEGAMDASQHHQARAVARRVAVRRRDHAQRIPQVHREGRRARTPLPDRSWSRRPASTRPIEILKGLRPKYEAHHKAKMHRRSARGRRQAFRPLPHRPLPARQGHRRDGRSRRARAHPGHDDPPARREEHRGARSRRSRADKEAAIKAQDFEKAAALRDSEKQAKDKLEHILTEWRDPPRREGSRRHRRRHHARRLEVDRRAALAAWSRRRHRSCSRWRANSRARSSARTKPSYAIGKALRRSRADLKDPKPAHRLVHFPRPDRRGQDLPGADARPIHVRRPRRAHPDRHDASTWTKFTTSRASSARLPATSVTRRAASSAKRCAAAPTAWCSSTKSRRPTPTSWNLLLQILEDGVVTDSLGRKVDFRNTIIIMTSNVGADLMRKNDGHGLRRQERRADLRRDEGQDSRGGQARLQARVHQPARRPHRLPLAHQAPT